VLSAIDRKMTTLVGVPAYLFAIYLLQVPLTAALIHLRSPGVLARSFEAGNAAPLTLHALFGVAGNALAADRAHAGAGGLRQQRAPRVGRLQRAAGRPAVRRTQNLRAPGWCAADGAGRGLPFARALRLSATRWQER
jgi:hypothetical protein